MSRRSPMCVKCHSCFFFANSCLFPAAAAGPLLRVGVIVWVCLVGGRAGGARGGPRVRVRPHGVPCGRYGVPPQDAPCRCGASAHAAPPRPTRLAAATLAAMFFSFPREPCWRRPLWAMSLLWLQRSCPPSRHTCSPRSSRCWLRARRPCCTGTRCACLWTSSRYAALFACVCASWRSVPCFRCRNAHFLRPVCTVCVCVCVCASCMLVRVPWQWCGPGAHPEFLPILMGPMLKGMSSEVCCVGVCIRYVRACGEGGVRVSGEDVPAAAQCLVLATLACAAL
jgi:hypothetical protein